MGYTIKQVSQLTGLSISTLRYYDREGLLPELRRLEAGSRPYRRRWSTRGRYWSSAR